MSYLLFITKSFITNWFGSLVWNCFFFLFHINLALIFSKILITCRIILILWNYLINKFFRIKFFLLSQPFTIVKIYLCFTLLLGSKLWIIPSLLDFATEQTLEENNSCVLQERKNAMQFTAYLRCQITNLLTAYNHDQLYRILHTCATFYKMCDPLGVECLHVLLLSVIFI